MTRANICSLDFVDLPSGRVVGWHADAAWLGIARASAADPTSRLVLSMLPDERTKPGRIYRSFETNEALLPQVVEYIGEDQLLLSTDMPHSELRDNAVSQLAARSDLSDATKRKIRHDNPIRFYGLAG